MSEFASETTAAAQEEVEHVETSPETTEPDRTHSDHQPDHDPDDGGDDRPGD